MFAVLVLWTRPIWQNPALAKNPEAITEALGDVVADRLVLETDGQHLISSGRKPPSPPSMKHRQLCSAGVLRRPGVPDMECALVIADGHGKCRNANGCAGLRVDPSVLADPKLGPIVRVAVLDPCSSLPPETGDPAEPIISSLSHPLAIDRAILRCDRGKRLRPKLHEFNRLTGVVRLAF